MGRIKVLSELVINQIAAGEVIERPASVLKELIENSIDANSSMIKIYIESGGISLIKVVDNGEGIHPDDIPLALVQHATSKIITTEDLSSINSLGFRGEALASIAAVSKVNIISRQVVPSGTTIEVKDIFYNLPARKKFLRSSITEYNFIQETFKRIALSNFNVGFMFYNNHKLIKNLPAIRSTNIVENLEDKQQRLSKLIGIKFINNAKFFNSEEINIQLCGWLSKWGNVSGSRVQYTYINNRVVKDKLLNMAIKQSIKHLSINPSYCLYLYINPTSLDINVHPSKQEVRFSDPKFIYAFVRESISAAVNKVTSEHNTFELNYYENTEEHAENVNPNKAGCEYNILEYLSSKGSKEITANDLNTVVTESVSFNEKESDILCDPKEILKENNINNLSDHKLDHAYDKIAKNRWQDAITSAFNYSGNKNLKLHANLSNITHCRNFDMKDLADSNIVNKQFNKFTAIFNNKYLLFESLDYVNKLVFLNVADSIKWLIKFNLNNIEKSTAYKLIIPERIKSEVFRVKELNNKIDFLNNFKFEINQIHDDTLLIRSIPDCLNLFDIKVQYSLFLEKFFNLRDDILINDNKIKEICIDFLVSSVELPAVSFYTKRDLAELIEELYKKKFNFASLNEKELEIFLNKNSKF